MSTASRSSSDTVRLRIDRDAYVATPRKVGTPNFWTYHFQIVARLENTSADTLYLGRCDPSSPTPLYVIRLVSPPNPDGGGYNQILACADYDFPIALALPPRVLRVDTLDVSGPQTFDGITKQPRGQLDGEFELIYGASRCQRRVTECPTATIVLRQRFIVRRSS